MSRIAIITVQVHIARCKEFLREALKVRPQFQNIEVRFIASEFIAMHKYEYAYLPEAMCSEAYYRTERREDQGVMDIREGRYDFGLQYADK